jgi:hypothetical protein
MPSALSEEDEAHYQAAQARFRERYKWVQKALTKVTYKKVDAAAPSGRREETTYLVLQNGQEVGYVGLKRRESWRKAGRIRTSLIGMRKDWWSGKDATGWNTYSDYAYSRTRATEALLEHVYDLSHPEVEEPGVA